MTEGEAALVRGVADLTMLVLGLDAAGAQTRTKDLIVEGRRSEKRVALVTGKRAIRLARSIPRWRHARRGRDAEGVGPEAAHVSYGTVSNEVGHQRLERDIVRGPTYGS
jgi:hypothetical protein